uniref:Alpha N-terminal protein methyltransferase 1 n=1 Tax=Panagrellus redivivus TaxID=6233 RepID=A0A7E4W6Q4_PANRE
MRLALANTAYRRLAPTFNLLRRSIFTSRIMSAPAVDDKDPAFYEKAEEYWASVASSVDGMLGGFERLHTPDINDSKKFLVHLRKYKYLNGNERALDCGSGIGRVTKHLLLPAFKTVDMVDVTEGFIENSKAYVGDALNPRVGNRFVEGLQTFEPADRLYDMIWVQWVAGHLNDEDFVSFFERCQRGIKADGVIVLKENLSKEKREFDEQDSSWTRPQTEILALFEKAGLDVVANQKQKFFPLDMYEVRMFALKPKPPST